MASENLSMDCDGSFFQVLECVVYYVDPTTSSNAMNAFVGSKERVPIPLPAREDKGDREGIPHTHPIP